MKLNEDFVPSTIDEAINYLFENLSEEETMILILQGARVDLLPWKNNMPADGTTLRKIESHVMNGVLTWKWLL